MPIGGNYIFFSYHSIQSGQICLNNVQNEKKPNIADVLKFMAPEGKNDIP